MAGGSGFVLGGVVTDVAGWRAVLWVELALAVALYGVVVRCVPVVPPTGRGRLDLAGAGALTGAVMAAVMGAALLEHPASRVLGAAALAAAGALGCALGTIERRAADPLLPRAALRRRSLRHATAAAALNTATTSSAATLATLYLQRAESASATVAGVELLPFSACVIAGATCAGRLGGRYAARRVIALGLFVIAAGDIMLLGAGAVPSLLPAGFGLGGLGIGLSSVAANALGTAVPGKLQGVASGLLNTGAQVGTAIGVSACVLVATLGGTSVAWACAGAAALAGAAVFGRSQPLR
jgi:MFS family permease